MSSTIEHLIIQTDPDGVERFIDRLATFRRDDWLAVASAAGRNATSRSTANALLDALIAHHGLGVQAWDAADDVDTAVSYSLGSSMFTPARREAARLRTARGAAKVAALALLTRPLLTSDDFDALYCPFAALIPPST